MNRKLINLLRIAAFILLIAAGAQALWILLDLHRAVCPQSLSTDTLAPLLVSLLAAFMLCMPAAACGISCLAGWRAHTMYILFVRFTWKDKLRVRFTPRPAFSLYVLPPRVDGAAPWVLPLLAPIIYMAAVSVLLALTACFTWQWPVARVFICASLGALLGAGFILLPGKNDRLLQALRFRRDARCRQAWECAHHITAAVTEKRRLAEMPEEWFPALPAALLDDRNVRYVMYHRAAWLIRTGREQEGYEALLPLLSLTPAPDTYAYIALSILNGAIVEALNDLPPRCLKQLDDPAVKYMTPSYAELSRNLALYARALFLHHDEQEAASLLPEIENHFTPDTDAAALTLRRLQEKAGVLPKEEDHAP